MPPLAPDTLALGTLTHSSAPELRALLKSVGRHLPGSRVVVVDCASQDETVSVARAEVSGCSVFTVALQENVGFGRACNRATAEIREPVTVLVNPDVELLDGSLAELAGEARRRARPEGLAGPLR